MSSAPKWPYAFWTLRSRTRRPSRSRRLLGELKKEGKIKGRVAVIHVAVRVRRRDARGIPRRRQEGRSRDRLQQELSVRRLRPAAADPRSDGDQCRRLHRLQLSAGHVHADRAGADRRLQSRSSCTWRSAAFPGLQGQVRRQGQRHPGLRRHRSRRARHRRLQQGASGHVQPRVEAGAVGVYACPRGRRSRRSRRSARSTARRSATRSPRARSRRCGATSSSTNQLNANPWAVGQWQNGEMVGVFPADKHGAQAARCSRSPKWVVTHQRWLHDGAGSGLSRLRPDLFVRSRRGRGMILFEVFLNGLLLGGMYGLIALGLNLQYGVARILNLSYGEFFMGGAFAAFFTIMLVAAQSAAQPVRQRADRLRRELADLPVSDAPADPARAGPGCARCRCGARHLRPALRVPGPCAGRTGAATCAATSFLSVPVHFLGATLALNRLLAFLGACVLALALFLVLRYTRFGTALARDHHRSDRRQPGRHRCAELLRAGVRGRRRAGRDRPACWCRTFISFSASIGVEYTLKALIVVILAGVGRVTGTLAAGLLLGVVRAGRRLSGRSGPDASPSTSRCSCWSCCGGRRGCSPVLELIRKNRGRIAALMALGALVLALLPLIRLELRDLALHRCSSPTSRWRPPGRSSPAPHATSRSRPPPSSASASTCWRSRTSIVPVPLALALPRQSSDSSSR